MSDVYETRKPQLVKFSDDIALACHAYETSCADMNGAENNAAMCATLGLIVAGNAIKYSVSEEVFVKLMREQYRRMKKRLARHSASTKRVQ